LVVLVWLACTETVSCRAGSSWFGPTSSRIASPVEIGRPSRVFCFMIAARPTARLVRSSAVPALALLARAAAVPNTAALPVTSVGPSPLVVLSRP
jgi:hypothetical protein